MENTHNEGIQKEQLENILKAIPPRHKNITPDFDLLEKVKKSGVILSGNVGSGKTYRMLQTIVAHMLEKHKTPFPTEVSQKMFQNHFMSVPNTLRMIKEEFDSPDAPRIVESLINKEILFLDDLGSEKASEWVKEQLYIILNERYNWCRPVMFTTNLQIKEIGENYGDRFASRLVEMCEILKIESPDRRLQKKKEN